MPHVQGLVIGEVVHSQPVLPVQAGEEVQVIRVPQDVIPLQITGLAMGTEHATELVAIGLVINAEIVEPRAHWLPAYLAMLSLMAYCGLSDR